MNMPVCKMRLEFVGDGKHEPITVTGPLPALNSIVLIAGTEWKVSAAAKRFLVEKTNLLPIVELKLKPAIKKAQGPRKATYGII